MSKVVWDVSVSLDGFTAGPNVREAEPLGDDGDMGFRLRLRRLVTSFSFVVSLITASPKRLRRRERSALSVQPSV